MFPYKRSPNPIREFQSKFLSKNSPDVWSSRVLTFYQSVSSCLLSLRRNTHTGFSVDLWENISFFSLCFFAHWIVFTYPDPECWMQKQLCLFKRCCFFYLKEQISFWSKSKFFEPSCIQSWTLCNLFAASNVICKYIVFLNWFAQTVCYWSVKQIAPPQTHTTGLVTVAMSGRSRFDSDMFTLFQGNQASVKTQYLELFMYLKENHNPYVSCSNWTFVWEISKLSIYLF